MPDESLGLLIGNPPIARFVTGKDKRGSGPLVKKLKEDGWPIFEIGDKNAARPSELTAEVLKREHAARANGAVLPEDTNPTT